MTARNILLSIGASLIFCCDANAGFITEGGLSLGGDDMAWVETSQGDRYTINAGAGYDLKIGYLMQTPIATDQRLRTELSIVYRNDSINWSNLDMKFRRTGVAVTQYLDITKKIRFGVGLVAHLLNNFSMEASNASPFTTDVNKAVGLNFSGDYFLLNNFYYGVRVNFMSYTNLGDGFNANSAGIHIGVLY